MSLNRHKLAIGVLAALMHQSGWAQPAATASLLEQGRYWQNQGDAKRAAQAWEKLLLSDPSQQEAMYGLGLAAVREKRLDDAQGYLTRLKQLNANGTFTKRLQQDIGLAGGTAAADLDRARMLAASGEIDKAMQAYDQALQGREPQGEIALEYYSFLGYTDKGLSRAITGLQRLSREMPGNPNVQLALAKHLIRDEDRRAEGVRMLAQLAQRKDVGADAAESWRAGLIWLGAPNASEKPLFEAYLAAHPDDKEVRAVYENPSAKRGAPAPVWRQDARLARGFAALKNGDLAAAEAAFQEKLSASPNDPDALGGLGLVRMQQDRNAEAQELLSRAAARPGAGRNWTRALAGVRYWNLLDQAEAARQRGDSDGARKLLEQAIRLDGNATGAYNAIGRAYASAGDMANAEKTYRYVLVRHKNDPEAVRGLADVLAQTGRAEEALRLVDALPAGQAGDVSRLRAAVMAGQAREAEKRGDTAGARRMLEDARRTDPRNPWTTYELARLLLRGGESVRAQQIMDETLRAQPDSADALHASALFASERGEWGRAYDTLARIPETRRTPEITRFQRNVWVHEQAAQAARLAQSGDTAQARQRLAGLQATAAGDPELLGAIAQAYIDAGDTPQALAVMRPLVNGSRPAGPDVLIPYASVLLKSGDDAGTAAVLRQVQKLPMDADQHRSFQDLVSLYTVRQAEAMRQRGDLVAAYDILQPVLKRRPDDPLAQGALARMYVAAGDRDKALAIYRGLQASDPDNAQLQIAVAGIAAEADDWRSAEASMDKALALAPNDPDVLAGAARIYRARGKTSRAAELYQQAIAAQQARGGGTMMASAAAPGGNADGNPFVGLPGQRSRSTRAAQVMGEALNDPQAATYGAGYGAGYGASYDGAPTASRQEPYVIAGAQDSRAAANAPAGGAAYGGGRGAVAPSLQQELDEVRQERSAEVRVGGFVRSNNGEAGMSKLTEIDSAVEALIPAGDGKISLRATAVMLDAGRLGDGYASNSRFGGGPVAAQAQQLGLVGGAGKQRDTGVGLSVGYTMQGLSADIGTTPLGFEYSNVVGGVRLNGPIDRGAGTWYSVDLSRRAVTDSLLSFAGARDDRTGQRWGAVTATGVGGQIGMDNKDYGVYAYGSWRSLDGHNVESNSRTEVGTGIYWNLTRETDRMLTAGLNLGAIFYDNNQRFFTYGHGGYFSPQQFYALSVPVTWAQRDGRFTYKLQGSVGLRHFKEDGADYFPTNGGMQAAANTANRAVYGASATYEGQSRTGVGYNLAAAGEYQLSPKLFLGGSLAMDNATDYRQYVGGLYLRYAFYPQTRPLDLPVNPYQSPYAR
ncbi:cellulose biosynthesis protein BcsC [Achromobacter insuavis]|uniref:cellulose biosynthesis protein BcsC n=1 Tax=Achromobacter insuavis TaxID=1287735 RepID=UPI001EEB99FA|nr:cellulose biosynthesis protein BcsC [Achromobacter insuavis]